MTGKASYVRQKDIIPSHDEIMFLCQNVTLKEQSTNDDFLNFYFLKCV